MCMVPSMGFTVSSPSDCIALLSKPGEWRLAAVDGVDLDEWTEAHRDMTLPPDYGLPEDARVVTYVSLRGADAVRVGVDLLNITAAGIGQVEEELSRWRSIEDSPSSGPAIEAAVRKALGEMPKAAQRAVEEKKQKRARYEQMLNEEPDLTGNEAAKRLDCSRRTVMKYRSELVRLGRVSPGKPGRRRKK